MKSSFGSKRFRVSLTVFHRGNSFRFSSYLCFINKTNYLGKKQKMEEIAEADLAKLKKQFKFEEADNLLAEEHDPDLLF